MSQMDERSWAFNPWRPGWCQRPSSAWWCLSESATQARTHHDLYKTERGRDSKSNHTLQNVNSTDMSNEKVLFHVCLSQDHVLWEKLFRWESVFVMMLMTISFLLQYRQVNSGTWCWKALKVRWEENWLCMEAVIEMKAQPSWQTNTGDEEDIKVLIFCELCWC